MADALIAFTADHGETFRAHNIYWDHAGLYLPMLAVPLIITMAVAAFIVHAEDPFSRKEHALLFLVPYLTLMLTGAGRFSLDSRVLKGKLSFLK